MIFVISNGNNLLFPSSKRKRKKFLIFQKILRKHTPIHPSHFIESLLLFPSYTFILSFLLFSMPVFVFHFNFSFALYDAGKLLSIVTV